MDKTLNCNHCGAKVAIVKGQLFVRKNTELVCYCKSCDTAKEMLIKKPEVDMPDIFKDWFK